MASGPRPTLELGDRYPLRSQAKGNEPPTSSGSEWAGRAAARRVTASEIRALYGPDSAMAMAAIGGGPDDRKADGSARMNSSAARGRGDPATTKARETDEA